MTDNTQELDEILEEYVEQWHEDGGLTVNGRITSREKAKQAILDWHNKQIEAIHQQEIVKARIAEIEHVSNYTNGMTNQMFENLKFRIAELKQEREEL